AEPGGPHVRRVSLARTAAWVVAAGPGEPTSTTVGPAPARAEGDERWRSSFAGEGIDAVAPPGSLGGNPLRWPGPPARYQTDDAAWSYRH
ncbi:MAG TPA: hypothetical protein VGR90_09280, partial [Acidimicrobiales bacterium]|nr:hypothetical protein [Acidimicrobiales bacterium]